MKPLVAILMGSKSDWETMAQASERLDALGVAHEVRVLSAHRTPRELAEYVESAKDRGIEVIIAGAGMSAALPGAVAALTTLPVLGVPVESGPLKGQDALLAMAQMPPGVPVGTLAIGKPGAVNAALLAAAILANKHPAFTDALTRFRDDQRRKILADNDPRDKTSGTADERSAGVARNPNRPHAKAQRRKG